MATNAGGLKIIAPTFGSVVVTLTTPAGTTPVVYSDAALTTTVALPVTVAAGGTQSIYLTSPGTYTLSVLFGGQQIADPAQGKVQTLDIGPGEFAVRDYTAPFDIVAATAKVLAGTSGDGVTDDTATINAALLAAGAGLVRLAPGLNYLISAPIIVRSGQTLDATGSTITLKAGSNCNMLNNAAVTAQRAVADGAITTATATLTSATAAFTAADTGRTAIIAGAGPGGGVLVSTMTYVNATTVTLANNAQATVSAAALSIYTRDSNITVMGGTWVHGANGGGTGTALHSIRFRRVDRLTIKNMTVTSTGGKYAINPGDVTRFRISGIDFNTSSDGVHIDGPASFGEIRDITGTTGDDTVCVDSVEWSAYADTAGDVTDITVSSVRASSLTTSVKVLGGTGTVLRRISIKDIYAGGTARAAVVIVDDLTGSTDADEITVDGVHPTAPMRSVEISASLARTVRLRDISNTKGLAAGISAIQVLSGAIVETLIVEGAHLSGSLPNSNSYLIHVASGATVSRLVADNLTGKFGDAGVKLVFIDGTCVDALIRNISAAFTTSSNVFQLSATGSVTRLTMSGVDVSGGGSGAVVIAAAVGAVLGSLVLSDCQETSMSWLGDLCTTTNVSLSNIVCANSFNIRATGNLTVRGAGLRGITGAPSITAGGALRLQSEEFPVDLSLTGVARTLGDAAYNTNGALACGAGQAVCNGTLWKGFYSAATY